MQAIARTPSNQEILKKDKAASAKTLPAELESNDMWSSRIVEEYAMLTIVQDAGIDEDLALAARPLDSWEKQVMWNLDSACTIHLTPAALPNYPPEIKRDLYYIAQVFLREQILHVEGHIYSKHRNILYEWLLFCIIGGMCYMRFGVAFLSCWSFGLHQQ